MGMDWLDIVFRLEKTFRIKVVWEELERYGRDRNPPDLFVRDLIAYVREKRPRFEIIDGVIAGDVACIKCGGSLRGVEPYMNCPGCGMSAAYEAQLRVGVNRVLLDALGVNPGQLHDDAPVTRDLGAV
jgi:hypothetical protein